MAARIIAQMIITGVTVVSKSVLSAYHQAIKNAKAGGVAHGPNTNTTVQVMKYKMKPDEALRILNIEKQNISKQLINERYKKMFEVNDPSKGGSFYLQSKVFRSKEVLENELLTTLNNNTNNNPTPTDTTTDNNNVSEQKNNRKKH